MFLSMEVTYAEGSSKQAWELEFKKQVDCKKNKGMGAECWELYCVEVSLAKKKNVEWLLVYQVGKDAYVAVTRWKPAFRPSQARCQILNTWKDFSSENGGYWWELPASALYWRRQMWAYFSWRTFPQGHVYVCRCLPFFWITNLAHAKETIYGKVLWSPVRLSSNGVRWDERKLWNYHGLGCLPKTCD